MRTVGWRLAIPLVLALSASARAEAPAIELEVAADRAAPFGAQQKWYGLLKEMDLASLRLRAARRGEEPSIENAGTERSPRYRVTAILDSKNQLRLPGGRFTERDRGRLAAYLRRLREEGIDGVTAERGLFGLTEKQFAEVHAELSEPVGFATADKRPREVADVLADRLAHRLVIDRSLIARLERAEPLSLELEKLSRGTALAIVLGRAGLEFRPHVRSGELLYEVSAARPQAPRRPRQQGTEESPDSWPVGWKSDDIPGRTVPELFEVITAQIDGYSLAEALEAIGSRLEVPLIIDRHSLQSQGVDMAEVQVKLPAGRYYERILSRILFQGRLKGSIRVDERGTPFYWITPL